MNDANRPSIEERVESLKIGMDEMATNNREILRIASHTYNICLQTKDDLLQTRNDLIAKMDILVAGIMNLQMQVRESRSI